MLEQEQGLAIYDLPASNHCNLYLLIQIINLLVDCLASKPCKSCQLVSEHGADDCKNNRCSGDKGDILLFGL